MPVADEMLTEIDGAIDTIVEDQELEEVVGGGVDAPEGVIEEKKDDGRKDDARSDPANADGDPDDKSGDPEGDLEGVEGETEPGDKDAPKKEDTSSGQVEEISDACLTRAVQAGLSLEEARSFPSSAVLDRAVDSMRAAVEAQRPPEEQEAPKEKVDPFAGVKKLDPEKYEPEVIELYDSLLDVAKKQHDELEELKSSIAEQSQYSERASHEAVVSEMTNWFDGKVAGLGKDFETVLGAGKMNSLDRYGAQFATREAIANKVAVFLSGYNAAGMQAPDRDEMFDDAARLVLKDTYQQNREKKLSDDLAKRGSQHIQRANSRKTRGHQSPLEEAAEMLNARFFARK